VRVYSGMEVEENTTSNQLFEVEKVEEKIDSSG
jgi:hypothetical protein